MAATNTWTNEGMQSSAVWPSDDGSVAPHGRGLLLVDAMSARWDTAGEDPLGWYTKGVWFELPTDGTPSRAGNQA